MAYTNQEPQGLKPYTKEEFKSLRKDMVKARQFIQSFFMYPIDFFHPNAIRFTTLPKEQRKAVKTYLETFIGMLKTSLIEHGIDTSELADKPTTLKELSNLFVRVEGLAKAHREDKVNPEAKSSFLSCFR
ncbi:MAG: hypothetical protein P4L79_07435 [Legionella sp.]|uniref:hypothetical protein n=1 Tax=Legionella sp. TaxID=459 RepID=UPI002851B6D7|nr:hypothetical protein [Legionella sp.]